MKILLILLCATGSLFGQYPGALNDSVRGIERGLQQDREDRERERKDAENRRFQETMRQTGIAIGLARRDKLAEKEQREAAVAAEEQRKINAYRPYVDKPAGDPWEVVAALALKNAEAEAKLKSFDSRERLIAQGEKKESVADVTPEPSHFQMLSVSNVVLKMDTATGKTWTLKSGAWVDVEEIKTGEQKIIAEAEVMNEWEAETTKQNPDYPKIQSKLIEFASPRIKSREKELGRPLTPSELKQEATIAYRDFTAKPQ